MSSFTRTLFGEPPKHMGQHVLENVFNLEVSLNKAWFCDDTTNFSHSFRKCSKQMTLKDLEMHFSGYMISWKELFSKLWNRNITDNFVFCNVDLSTDAPSVLRHVDKFTIKRYVIVNAIMTSDVYNILPQDVPRFVRDGRAKKELTGWYEGIEHQCLIQMTKYIPKISLFSPTINSEKTELDIHQVFTELQTSFENVFEDLYWIPEDQRKKLLQPFDDVSVQYEWRHQNGSTFAVSLADFTATDNYFLNFHSLLSTWNSYRINTGNVSPSYGLMWEKRPIDVPAHDIKTPLFYQTSQRSVLYGSTGSYLAQTIARRFDIDAFLSQYTNGLIDHQVAFTLAYRLQCLIEWFDKYEMFKESGKVYKIRGDLTKNKNLQDSLALRAVYEAWSADRLEGDSHFPGLPYTDAQLFFITYAQTMCEKIDIRGMKRFYMEESGPTGVPYKYRVIGTLSNYQAFSDAFSCEHGTNMNPEEKCAIL